MQDNRILQNIDIYKDDYSTFQYLPNSLDLKGVV